MSEVRFIFLICFFLPFPTIKQSSAIFSLGHFNLFFLLHPHPHSLPRLCLLLLGTSEMDKTECQNVNVFKWKRNCERLQFCFCHLCQPHPHPFLNLSPIFFYFGNLFYLTSSSFSFEDWKEESWTRKVEFSDDFFWLEKIWMKKKAFNRISIISGPDSYSNYGVADRNEGIFCLFHFFLFQRLAF